MAYYYRGQYYCDECGQAIAQEIARGEDPPLWVSEDDRLDEVKICPDCIRVIPFRLNDNGVKHAVALLADYAQQKLRLRQYHGFLHDSDLDLLRRMAAEEGTLDWWDLFALDVFDHVRREHDGKES